MRGAGMTAYKERLKICDVPNLAKQQLMLHRIILYMVQVLDEHKWEEPVWAREMGQTQRQETLRQPVLQRERLRWSASPNIFHTGNSQHLSLLSWEEQAGRREQTK